MGGRGTFQNPGGIPYGGLLHGIILDNTLPNGRAKVWIPVIHGEDEPLPSDLPDAIVTFPWGGVKGTGAVMMPPIGASVIVGFLYGTVWTPVVLGPYFGQEGIPSEAQAAPAESAITIQHASGWVIKVDFAEPKMEVRGPGPIEISAQAPIVLSSMTGIQIKTPTGQLWQPCIVSNCLVTGAPHGGVPGGITDIEGAVATPPEPLAP